MSVSPCTSSTVRCTGLSGGHSSSYIDLLTALSATFSDRNSNRSATPHDRSNRVSLSLFIKRTDRNDPAGIYSAARSPIN